MKETTPFREKLDELSSLTDRFMARKARATERLKNQTDDRWFFGILGLEMEVPEYPFEPIATLRPVVEPPGEVELAAALSDKALMSAVGRYSHGIRHELSVNRGFYSKDQVAFDVAWWFLSVLRVRTLADFLVPAVSSHSWSVIAAVTEGSCKVQLLEDIPRARRFAAPTSITQGDLDWARGNLESFAELLQVPKFRLAVDSLTTHQHEASLRMTTASLWAGIEALFGINSELRFRLAALVAAFLEPAGPDRILRYRSIKALYDFRSRAVHGAVLEDAALQQHICDVRRVLSSLLCRMVESKHVPLDDEWDSILFA